MPFGTQRGWMRYALPHPEILSYPLSTNVIDSVVLNCSGVAPDASGPFQNRRYLLAGTVLSKRPDNTYEEFTNATSVAAVDQVWDATIEGAPTGGTWLLGYMGVPTSALAYNISAADLEDAIEALSTIGEGNVTVTGSAGGPYTITAASALAGEDLENFTYDASLLTGSPSADISVSVTTRGAPAESTQNVAGILFDTVEFADGSMLSDEPVAMLRRDVSFNAAAIVNFATYETQIVDGLPTCEFI